MKRFLFFLAFFLFCCSFVNAKVPEYIKQRHRGYPPTEVGKFNTRKPDFATPINVHVIAHTHDDVGWLKTVDEYFYGANSSIQEAGVQYILDTVITALQQDPSRKFIYVEIAFFERWWNEQNDQIKQIVRNLVAQGRLEFINGGWCMNDEANVHYTAIIDQMTEGHNFLYKEFNVRPTIGWHIDPFGHAATQASLFAQMGFNAFFFGRIDYQDHDIRNNSQRLEFVWRGSNSLGAETEIFSHVLYTDYCYPQNFGFEWGADPVQDDPRLEDLNIKFRADDFANEVRHRSISYRTNNVLIPFGCDFQYQNAHINFKNMDKLIAYINSHPEYNMKLHYSTPSIYLKAVHDAGLTWEVFNYDFFPYADDAHSYWTGYFTSRVALKGYVRSRNNLLQSVEKLYTTAGIKSNNGLDSISQLSQAYSIAQHHDAVAGTEKQHVAYDYAKRLSIGSVAAEGLISEVLGKKISKSGAAPSFQFCPFLNMSDCPPLQQLAQGQSVSIVFYNPLGWQRAHHVRVPVPNSKVQVYDGNGNMIPSQVYPNADVANTYNLAFEVSIPPVGFTTVIVQNNQLGFHDTRQVGRSKPVDSTQDAVLENSFLRLTFSGATGKLATVTNKQTGQTFQLQQNFFWYNASAGNTNDQQASGAYIMRTNTSKQFDINTTPSLSILTGPLVSEVTQVWNSWTKAVTRLYNDSNHFEFEATLGPIDISDGLGKELISQYTSSLKTGSVWYTDSEGLEMQRRQTNYRPTWNYTVTEPISSNFYPMNIASFIEDTNQNIQVTFVTDRSHACGGIVDGEIEHLLQRRLLYDDSRGVGEPLNETEPIRTFQLVGVSQINDGSRLLRSMSYLHYGQPVLAFSPFTGSASTWTQKYQTSFTALTAPLPQNVHLVTLKPLDNGQTLIRLHHIFAVGEDSVLSKPVSVDLSTMFADYSVSNVVEMSLSANQPLSNVHRLKWKTASDARPFHTFQPLRDNTVVLRPMEIRTFVVNLTPKK